MNEERILELKNHFLKAENADNLQNKLYFPETIRTDVEFGSSVEIGMGILEVIDELVRVKESIKFRDFSEIPKNSTAVDILMGDSILYFVYYERTNTFVYISAIGRKDESKYTFKRENMGQKGYSGWRYPVGDIYDKI